MIDVSVVVVSYNTRDLLTTCLRSVIEAAVGLTYEVIIVDNASADGSQEMIQADFPNARLIANAENRGFAAANNQAFHVALGRYILLLNSDAIVAPDALTHLVRFMDGTPRIGIVGGQLLNADGTFQSSYADFPTWTGELLLLTGLSRWFLRPSYPSYPAWQSRSTAIVQWVGGALLMARRDAIAAVGGLDETYFMYSEEMDWCLRMRQHGWQVAYVPTAKATHLSGASAHRQPERRRAQVYKSKYLFIAKHWGSLQAALFLALVRVVSATKLIAWWICAKGPARISASFAGNQVRSYQFLLTHLAEDR